MFATEGYMRNKTIHNINRLDDKYKHGLVSELAFIIFYCYLVEEHKNVTERCNKLKDKDILLKNFSLEMFPFTKNMITDIQNNKEFRESNPNLGMEKYFQVDKTAACTDICK